MEISVLRIGQRLVRDDRVTTHVALVARAFGASQIYMNEVSPDIGSTIEAVNGSWGGDFGVTFIDDWMDVIIKSTQRGYAVVHLTMYGLPVSEAAEAIAREAKILVVVGAQKVPRQVYDLARYNVAVSSQPHSEISALAVLLDRVQGGRQFEKEFVNARRTIIPRSRGKTVVDKEGINTGRMETNEG